MVNLSWKLAMVLNGHARKDLLDTYQSDRLPVIHQLVRMTERATRALNSTNRLVLAALTRLAPIVLARSRVQDKAAPRLGQLAAGYRGCPIAQGGGRTGSLRAGDRVPDFRVGGGRLYDLLDLSTLTLFVTGDRAPEAYRPWRDVVALRRVSIDDYARGLAARPARRIPRGRRRTRRRARCCLGGSIDGSFHQRDERRARRRIAAAPLELHQRAFRGRGDP